jgi:hypothetical protein
MDIILDSNVYISDFRMEHIPFKNLFDYLRRTRSSLVLLGIVKKEVLAHFARMVKKSFKEANEFWDPYRLLHFPQMLPKLTKPDVEDQKRQLDAKLMRPSDGFAVRYYDDTSRIPVEEIYLRGVNRIPPANGEGEELRDVIVWLSAIDYARETKQKVAFISNDSGFWIRDTVRPEIQKDIDEAKVDVQLFRTIEGFVEHNSLPAREADEKWAQTIFSECRDDTISAVERSIKSRGTFAEARDFTLKKAHFIDGKIFGIAEQIQLAELTFEVQIEFSSVILSNLVPMSTMLKPASTLYEAFFRRSASAQVFSPFESGVVSSMHRTPWIANQPLEPRFAVEKVESRQLLSGTIYISARLLKEVVSEKEISEVRIENIIEVAGERD